jgi:hypothetical protein
MSFSDEVIQEVWEKATPIYGCDVSKIRKDHFDNLIKREDYENKTSTYGWKIDRISSAILDSISNLRPLKINE